MKKRKRVFLKRFHFKFTDLLLAMVFGKISALPAFWL